MAYRIVDGAEARQGTPEWLAWRLRGLGASDAPAVMGRSKWTTPYGLFRQKIGLDPGPKMNPAMARGIRLEPKARAAYERFTGNVMVPVVLECIEHPILRASLDGLEANGKTILEIKCPGKEAHLLAMNGIVPENYVDQVQQQLYVSGAEVAHYWSFDGDEGALVVVYPDPDRIKLIIEESQRFWERVESQTWSSNEWEAAANIWRAAKAAADEMEEIEKNARRTLVSLLKDDEPKREGSGVVVTRVNRTGAFDYDAFLKEKGIEITPEDELKYRKKGQSTVQVKEAANAEDLDLSTAQMPKPVFDKWGAAEPVPDDFVLAF